jgi:hypothetical protein
MFIVFFVPRIETFMQNNPHYHVSKVSLPMGRNGCQSWTFQCNFIRLFDVALPFRRATVNWLSSIGKVNDACGQTDRIIIEH